MVTVPRPATAISDSGVGTSCPAKLVRFQPTGLLDLPKELVANVVGHLPYAALPDFRTTCKLARELVDAASNGWVMKVEEGEALQTSRLLQRLTSLVYVWFESWNWEGEQETNFLAVILTNLGVFARLQEVRFPGTPNIPLRCLRGLLAALPAVTNLALPPLPAAIEPDSAHHRAALGSIASLSTLTDLNLEGWALTDHAAKTLGAGLPRLQRIILGSTAALTRAGYEAVAQLQGLASLTASGARGDNSTVEPLTALTGLTGLRLELAAGFGDVDAGPLACLPALRTLGWWHAEAQRPSGLRPGSVAPWLRELSLCMDLDARALSVLAGCSRLVMMQVQSITLPTLDGDPAKSHRKSRALRPTPAAAAPSTAAAASRPSLALPVLPSLRTLILGELSLPPPSAPQPVARLSAVFPYLENILAFQVVGRGLQQLDRAERLKRMVLNCQRLRDAVLEFLPPLPSLVGLQLESCQLLTDSAVGALRATPGVEQLMLLDTPAVTDAFLSDATAMLHSVRALVLSRLPNVHDEGLQSLAALAGSLEHLELRCMPALTPAGLQVVLRLPRVSFVGVCECGGVDKAACKELAAALAAAGRDVSVEHETTVLAPVTLADDFGDQPGGQDEGRAAGAPGAGHRAVR